MSELGGKKKSARERKKRKDYVSNVSDVKRKSVKDWKKSAFVERKKNVADSSRSVLRELDVKKKSARERRKKRDSESKQR